MLVARRVIQLRINRNPVLQLIHRTQIQFGVTIVKIPVWQQQGVSEIRITEAEKGRVIAAAGESGIPYQRPLFPRNPCVWLWSRLVSCI